MKTISMQNYKTYSWMSVSSRGIFLEQSSRRNDSTNALLKFYWNYWVLKFTEFNTKWANAHKILNEPTSLQGRKAYASNLIWLKIVRYFMIV